MSTIEKYIYGIINSNGETIQSSGNPGLKSGEFPILQCGVLHNENAYVISYDGISAVVSDAEKVDYHNLPRETLARCLVKHQQVIEKVMKNFTVIPMRLGTYALDEEEVRQILAKGGPLIKDIFIKVADAVEVDVAATWNNFEQVIKEAGNEPEIKEFKEKIRASAKGVTLEDQLKVGVLIKKALDVKKESIVSEIQAALKSVSLDFKTHAVMNDQMVMNTAFLIKIARREDFDQKIDELNAKYTEKLNFRCVGPLPPYSFYTLEAKKIDFAEIEWARKKLKMVNDHITESEVKKAYKSAALLSHPDVNPENSEGFDELTRAYAVLCASAGQDGLIIRVRGA